MTRIHPSAIVDPGAVLGEDVEIGPCCVIGPHVVLGNRVRAIAHAVIDGHTRIGDGCEVFPFAGIGGKTQDLKYRGAKTFVEIGPGTVVRESVTINSGTAEGETTRVGAGCLLMACSHVAHACAVGDGVILANSVALAGEVVVEDNAVIGGLVGVHQFVRIGRMSMIGGLSPIRQDVPPFMLVEGNPAVVRGINAVGLERRGVCEKTRRALTEAYKLIFRGALTTAEALAQVSARMDGVPEVDYLVEFVRNSKRGVTRRS